MSSDRQEALRSELFLQGVPVPEHNLLGRRAQGWEIALQTLAHERGTAALPRQVKLRSWVDRPTADARARSVDGRRIADHEDAQVALARARAMVVRAYETYLVSRTATVLGGTQQIQRNIMADRILQLPKE